MRKQTNNQRDGKKKLKPFHEFSLIAKHVFRSRQNLDEESETISSSVYHGESDSVRMESGEPKASNSRRKPAGQVTSNMEDALVGHAFGERPLLADDELDDDSLHSGLPRAAVKTGRLPLVPLPFR